MGLFVGSDGRYRGWLAALLCCCAAVNDDDDTMVRHMDRTGVICNEQPIQSRPMTAALSFQNEAGFDYNDRVRPIADRPPSLKPLDFGDASLLGRVSSPAWHKSSNSNIKRITIGQPTAFRRLEYTERQRRSLIPLHLEPVTLRYSVVETGSDLALSRRFIEEENLAGSLTSEHHPNGSQWTHAAASALSDDASRTPQPIKERLPKRPALLSRSSSSSMRSMRRQALESQSSSSSSPLNRKRNSLRKPSSESIESDVEQEILELNTIVEEIRSESSRSSDGHVSAVAPLMSIKARPETLNDIGSAFSRPRAYQLNEESEFSARDLETRTVSPMENRLSRPFAMPDLLPEPDTMNSGPRPSSKIGEWLKSNIMGTYHKPTRRTHEDFYSCRPYHRRAISEASTAVSAVSALDSPTASHCHSRAVTAESVMTPASTAPSTGREFLDTEHMVHSSIKHVSRNDSYSEVGVAL